MFENGEEETVGVRVEQNQKCWRRRKVLISFPIVFPEKHEETLVLKGNLKLYIESYPWSIMLIDKSLCRKLISLFFYFVQVKKEKDAQEEIPLNIRILITWNVSLEMICYRFSPKHNKRRKSLIRITPKPLLLLLSSV